MYISIEYFFSLLISPLFLTDLEINHKLEIGAVLYFICSWVITKTTHAEE